VAMVFPQSRRLLTQAVRHIIVKKEFAMSKEKSKEKENKKRVIKYVGGTLKDIKEDKIQIKECIAYEGIVIDATHFEVLIKLTVIVPGFTASIENILAD
jgi:hypothetical protein